MEASSTIGLQVKLDTLPALHRELVKALGGARLSATELNEVITRCVRATCVVCRIQITGTDLHAVALADLGEALLDPRLARLQQGYCCRRGCDSYYYHLQFAPYPACDWQRIVTQLAATPLTPGTNPTEDGDAPSECDHGRRKFVLRTAAGAILLLGVFGIRHVWSGGSLPGVRRPPKYSADPASILQVPRE
jgi:hypothetical protein